MDRLGDDATRLLAAAGAPGLDAIAAIVAVWPDAVGDTVARNAWPLRLGRDGTLHVATTSATWSFELGRLAGEVLGRLCDALGEQSPSSLRFAPGPVPEPPAPVASPAAAAPAAGPAETRAAAAAASVIEDADLRELVARAAAASLARGSDDQPVW